MQSDLKMNNIEELKTQLEDIKTEVEVLLSSQGFRSFDWISIEKSHSIINEFTDILSLGLSSFVVRNCGYNDVELFKNRSSLNFIGQVITSKNKADGEIIKYDVKSISKPLGKAFSGDVGNSEDLYISYCAFIKKLEMAMNDLMMPRALTLIGFLSGEINLKTNFKLNID